ncbi:hypothetical protein TcWFU_005821 [Taenia crassiceps]|uniref:Uncharacterized protein n=1 Tax=Taenia crassiceps TaxID=6207 RepID=A0ABR4QBR3_9CEST
MEAQKPDSEASRQPGEKEEMEPEEDLGKLHLATCPTGAWGTHNSHQLKASIRRSEPATKTASGRNPIKPPKQPPNCCKIPPVTVRGRHLEIIRSAAHPNTKITALTWVIGVTSKILNA